MDIEEATVEFRHPCVDRALQSSEQSPQVGWVWWRKVRLFGFGSRKWCMIFFDICSREGCRCFYSSPVIGGVVSSLF